MNTPYISLLSQNHTEISREQTLKLEATLTVSFPVRIMR